MGRKFDIPTFYRSSVVSSLKQARRVDDQRKKDLSPTSLDLGKVRFKIARHFGFCFGVENAIERAYRSLAENPGKRVFLLSEMIHNPHVNSDLESRGVRFILKPDGTQIIPFEELTPDDIVIVPAFGTTVDLFKKLRGLGIDTERYNATCPFVEKVWKRSEQLGTKGYTVIIHGKHSHEETRATFSHARVTARSLVIRDVPEAEKLSAYIRGEIPLDQFSLDFAGRFSEGFSPERDLVRIGVVNQTTMLATETQHISDILRAASIARYGEGAVGDHFADTRDTLCYATSENQDATKALMEHHADFAVVVGGYNSSNTSHLVELLEARLPTYYIEDESEIRSTSIIRHLDLHSMKVKETSGWLPLRDSPIEILLTAGASCPDSLVDRVLKRIAELAGVEAELEPAVERTLTHYNIAALASDESLLSPDH